MGPLCKDIGVGRWFRKLQGSIAKVAKTELRTSSPGMVAPGVQPTYAVLVSKRFGNTPLKVSDFEVAHCIKTRMKS